MAYFIGGTSGESNAFEKTIQNSAIQVLHESQGLVNLTNVVMPNQGNTYKVPSMAPISYGDYVDTSYNPTYSNTGSNIEQTAQITAREVVATPAVAMTAFSKFLGWTTAFDLAANLGTELGMSFAEKVDQRITAAFTLTGSAVTTGDVSQTGFANTNTAAYFTGVSGAPIGDGFNRVFAMASQGLIAEGSTATITNTYTAANTVAGMVRNVIKAWRESRNPGRPTVILGPSEELRLLSELTGGAVYAPGASGGTSINAGLTALGDELLATGMLRNLYGCTVIFTTFLQTNVANRWIDNTYGTASYVGAAIGPQAITTVMVKGLDISMGDKDGGLQTWITGLGYFGSAVVAPSRGLAINIA